MKSTVDFIQHHYIPHLIKKAPLTVIFIGIKEPEFSNEKYCRMILIKNIFSTKNKGEMQYFIPKFKNPYHNLIFLIPAVMNHRACHDGL